MKLLLLGLVLVLFAPSASTLADDRRSDAFSMTNNIHTDGTNEISKRHQLYHDVYLKDKAYKHKDHHNKRHYTLSKRYNKPFASTTTSASALSNSAEYSASMNFRKEIVAFQEVVSHTKSAQKSTIEGIEVALSMFSVISGPYCMAIVAAAKAHLEKALEQQMKLASMLENFSVILKQLGEHYPPVLIRFGNENANLLEESEIALAYNLACQAAVSKYQGTSDDSLGKEALTKCMDDLNIVSGISDRTKKTTESNHCHKSEDSSTSGLKKRTADKDINRADPDTCESEKSVCRSDLIEKKNELDQCWANLAQCTNDHNICLFKLMHVTPRFQQCTYERDACSRDLVNRTNELLEYSKDKATCNSNLLVTTSQLRACIDGKDACMQEKDICNTNLANNVTELNKCNDNLSTCKPNVSNKAAERSARTTVIAQDSSLATRTTEVHVDHNQKKQ
ncbi:hypothetical protein BGW42_003267 [Actinomortierella wolfii]|nr:hypothetical protein BGW42_003267 [Actinomortierella wolfii]